MKLKLSKVLKLKDIFFSSIFFSLILLFSNQVFSLTTIDTHNQGTAVNAINAADDALLDLGDDFGFSENRFDFNDGKTYSPSKGVDV